MIDMQMGQHDEIDIFRRQPERRQPLQIRRLQTVEGRLSGPLLVVAAAGIDQDVVPAGADHVAFHAADQAAQRGREKMRHQRP